MSVRIFHSRWLSIVLIVCLLAGCHSKDGDQESKSVALPTDEVVLRSDSPKRGYIKEAAIELTQRPLMELVAGKIAYDETRTARVSSPIAGRVIGIIAALGRLVNSGDVLLELDSPDLGQAQSDYAGALADLSLADRAFQRVKGLYENGILPRKDLEQAQDDLARSRSEAERARLKLRNLGVQGMRTDNRFALHAPIAGAITERNVNPGMEIRPDLAAPLFVISDLGRLWLLMDVFEKDLRLVHVGQSVLVSVPAFPGERFPATVDYIAQNIDETTRTVKVRCVLPNPDGRLIPAMFASVEVLSDATDRAVVVPLTALFTEGESDWVFVAEGDGHYRKRAVTVGLRLRDKAVITTGLDSGERLVVDGALLLRTEEDAEQEGGDRSP